MSFLNVCGISAGYGNKNIISGISFKAEKGSITGLLGANGSGKTTLLKAMCSLLPHKGHCVLDGITLDNLSHRKLSKLCSYIPQRSGITIDISALDVVLMGFNPHLGILQHPNAQMITLANEALFFAGLSDKADENYLTLSEGQKQLCIIARTLVSAGKLLLLDEPESALDFRYRHKIINIISSYVHKESCAAVVALHDPQLALNFCDQLVVLSEGKASDIIFPASDSFGRMENVLSKIYGQVSLVSCCDKNGHNHIVMLKEDDL